jgi:hypothetical protein
MKFATLVIFACLKCVTVKSQGSLRVEDKSSNKAATAAELTQVDDPKTNDDAIVNADERAEADWGLKSSVREAMVCTPLWYINCDGVCHELPSGYWRIMRRTCKALGSFVGQKVRML